MKKRNFIILFILVAITATAIIAPSCEKHNMLGSFQVSFTFSWNGKNFTAADLDKHTHGTKIEIDTIINNDTITRIDTVTRIDTTTPMIRLYDTTASKNLVNLSEIRYFLYGISIVDVDGNYHSIDGDSIHYIDLKTPSTLSWHSAEKIPTGIYDSIVFYFGLSENDNVYRRFTDPPESNMEWPDKGYHFMMTDGHWRNVYESRDTFDNFGLHITAKKGIRLAYAHRFYLTEKSIIKKSINMALDKWFNVEPVWDFNDYGASIMEDPAAQKILLDRVDKVFSVK